MRFAVKVNGVDVSNVALVEGLEINRTSHEAISTARVSCEQRLKPVDKFAAREWAEWSLIEIAETQAPNALHFAGYVSEIGRSAQDNEKFAVALSSVDFGVLLDRRVSELAFEAATDRAIVKALAAEAGHGITAPDAAVDFTATLDEFDARDLLIREALERLCERTGCRWHVDAAKVLHYYKPGLRFAPFNLSDTPDFLLSFPYQMTSCSRNFSTGANQITLLGGPGESGGELRVIEKDDASIAAYGLLEAVKVDRTITATAVGVMTAQADLAERSTPRVSGKALIRQPVEFWRLQLGQMIGIKSALYGVDDNYVITGIREFTDVKGTIAYEISWGAREADLVTTLRMLSRRETKMPQAVIGPDTTIPAENITGKLDADQIDGVYAESLIGQVNSDQISGVAAESIEGSIQADQIGTVSGESITGVIGGPGSTATIHAQSITGVIVSDQLADQILDSLRLVGPTMGVIERVPAAGGLPSLPNPEYPVGNSVLMSGIYGVSRYGTGRYGSMMYKNVSNTWQVASASGELTGILKFNDIESIQAKQIIGLIIAQQIQSIFAEQIVGTIDADHIEGIYADSIIGTISGDQIDSVRAETIYGTITAVNVIVQAAAIQGAITGSNVTVNAANIYGDITGSNVLLNAANLYGTISATSVVVQAAALQGTITGTNISIDAARVNIGVMQGTQVVNVRGETINIGSIHDSSIGDVSGSKLNVGTVNSDKLNAVAIAVGGGGGKPGQLTVHGASGAQVGAIGVFGTDEGIWASKGAFGGTGFATAVVKVIGSTYDLQIAGATSTIKISTTVFDPAYSSIGMQVYDTSSFSTWQVSRGFILYGPGNQQLAAMAKNPSTTRGELVLYTSGDAQGYILASGGVVRADRGFQMGGNPGLSTSISYMKAAGGTGTLTFNGGILTGSS